MHIGLLSSQRDYYGGEVHLYDLAIGLCARGHRVTCLVRPDSRLAARLSAADVPVRGLPLVDWYEPVGMLALRRCLDELRVDVLHTHNPRDYYIGAAATLGTEIHNVGTRHQLRPITWSKIKRPFLRRFSAMIAVSEAVHEGLLASGLPAHRLVTVPNGIRLPVRGVSQEALRQELGLSFRNGPLIGSVGRLCPSKGQDCLLWAASLLRGRWPDLQVVLIGGANGNLRFERELRCLARGLRLPVHFCGYRDEAARLVAAFDVAVVPSRAEPFGLVTLEALARGVPLVATRTGGTREIVHDGRDGLLVPPGDPEALASALDRLLEDRDLRERCARAGLQRVASRFAHDRQVSLTERVYDSVLCGAPLAGDETLDDRQGIVPILEARTERAGMKAEGCRPGIAGVRCGRLTEHAANHRHETVDDELHRDDGQEQSHELLDDAQAGAADPAQDAIGAGQDHSRRREDHQDHGAK